MKFDLSKYETVQERLDVFHSEFPDGRIETILVEYSDNRYIIQALGYKNADDMNPFATGYAEEIVGSSPVNKTSAIENCETSAIGRMLRNGGIGKNASREEMEKVERGNAKQSNTTAVKVYSAEEIIDMADKSETIDQLRTAWSLAIPSILETPWQYTDEGGFVIDGTVADYLKHIAQKLQ